jgi:hypothetical protein
MLERLVVASFYPFFLAAVSAAAAPAVGIKEGITLSLAALAWFVFARLLVNVYSCAVAGATTRSRRSPLAFGSLIVDGLGILATLHMDADLIWSTLVAIAISEAVTWSSAVRDARPSQS